MKKDYLWNKSGEPDPKVQELERILGTLKFQPRPLEIPARLQTGPRRFLFPSFAIAAAITLVALGVGLWLGLHHRNETSSGVEAVKVPSSTSSPLPSPSDAEHQLAIDGRGDDVKVGKNTHTVLSSRRQGSNNSKHANSPIVAKRLSEREEAVAAKAQLMIALRVASSKLNLAQKKTQGAYPTNLIRNQHKAG